MPAQPATPLTPSGSKGPSFRSCKACSAPTEFDPKSGGLKCPYCGAQKEISRGPVDRHTLDEMAALARLPDGSTRTVRCTQCGAQATLAGNVAATQCGFCAAPLAATSEIKATPPAEGVVPFAITKDDAGERFSGWLKGLWFRPSNLKRLGRLREIRGIYIPNWAFDAAAFSTWTAEAGYYYTVEKTEIVNGEERTVTVTETRWEPAAGEHSAVYTDLLVSASTGLSPTELKEVEPFDLDGRLTAFDGDFLAGFDAESHARDVADSWNEAAGRIRSMEHSACESMVPGDTHRFLSVSTATSEEYVRSLLVPLYVAAYEYSGKIYRVVINGQTGKATGQAPWSVWKIVSFSIAMLLIVIGLVYFFQQRGH